MLGRARTQGHAIALVRRTWGTIRGIVCQSHSLTKPRGHPQRASPHRTLIAASHGSNRCTLRWLMKGCRRNAGASAHAGTRDRAGTADVGDHQGHRMPKPQPHEATWPPTASVAPSHADRSFPRLQSVHAAMAHERVPEECWGERARRGTQSRWYGGRGGPSGASYAKATATRSHVATHSERRPIAR